MTDLTPMMKQYNDVKASVPDALLFFRLGDFYEMFGDDALVASKELEITLTGRGQGDNRAPMCGVPFHSVDPYISKLISKGYKVAICEQVEDPALAKGIVKREVIRIVTPGTVTGEMLPSEKDSNYLAAISVEKNSAAIAYMDVSTGEFKTIDLEGPDAVKKLREEIDRISPSECLLASDLLSIEKDIVEFLASKNILVTPYDMKDIFDRQLAQGKLQKHFRLSSLEGFGYNGVELSLCAASAVLDYAGQTQKTQLPHVTTLKKQPAEDYMYIDPSTRRNLELVRTIKDGSFEGSLLWVLDRTKTPMGARLLRSWLLLPLTKTETINTRLDAVEELSKSTMVRQQTGEALDGVRDIERLTGRIASASANAKDLIALKESLQRLPELEKLTAACRSELIRELKTGKELEGIALLIERAITDDPPFTIKDGGIIKKGFNEELDGIKEAAAGGKQWISDLEAAERERTGIKSLKVGFTKVFGYYIEVSSSNQKFVPMDYIRKQTLVNCERYITPELKEKESMILNSQDRQTEMEYAVFCSVRDEIAKYIKELQAVSYAVAQVDAVLSLANVAVAEDYVRPRLFSKPSSHPFSLLREKGSTSSSDSTLIIKEGRHPVAEKTIGRHNFVPNDTLMDENGRFVFLTGPNMAGKSTYMRQVAQIVLLAQMGSFVPAKEASVPVVDRIFTRVGAFDDLYSGQSTFMVEMLETANILNNATANSLIILDEIGRGTATFDGMSIAGAVAEYIHSKIKAKTLFATHYHELTQTAEKTPGMKNLNVAVKEEGERVIFLHKIVDGPADKSYGIHVGKLAGLPAEVIRRAGEIYSKLEKAEDKIV